MKQQFSDTDNCAAQHWDLREWDTHKACTLVHEHSNLLTTLTFLLIREEENPRRTQGLADLWR